jgi:hypothetical protein
MDSFTLVTHLADFLGKAVESQSTWEHCVTLVLLMDLHSRNKVLMLLGKLLGIMMELYTLIVNGSPQLSKKEQWLVNEVRGHYEQCQQAPASATTMSVTAWDCVIHA